MTVLGEAQSSVEPPRLDASRRQPAPPYSELHLLAWGSSSF